jgi:hypothetical protein
MLQHVSIEVHPGDVPRTVELWEAIGFRVVEAPGEINPYVTWLERKGTQIHLIHSEEPTIPALGHPAVVAEPYDEVLENVRAGGFELEEHRELWGARRWFVVGPGGHRTELMESAPPASTAVGDGG